MLATMSMTNDIVERIMAGQFSRMIEWTIMSKYIKISWLPMTAIKQVFTLVNYLFFILLFITSNPKNIDKIRNGKGTTVPGLGTHAVCAALISYPSSH